MFSLSNDYLEILNDEYIYTVCCTTPHLLSSDRLWLNLYKCGKENRKVEKKLYPCSTKAEEVLWLLYVADESFMSIQVYKHIYHGS